MFITDEKGKWEVNGHVRLLIEPSTEYIAERETEAQEQELLNSLVPSQKEIEKAEREIETILLLQDLEVI